jgi:threonine dehydrogenase-like Zn-dependent dehydrogenase
MLIHGTQGDTQVLAVCRSADSDDSAIVGHAQSSFLERLQGTDGYGITDREDGVGSRRQLQQPFCSLIATYFSLDFKDIVAPHSVAEIAQCRNITPPSADTCHYAAATQMCNIAIALIDQMFGGNISDTLVICCHGGNRGKGPIDQDQWHPHFLHGLPAPQLAIVEPLSIGAQAVMRSGLKAGELVVVVGAGPIGVAITQMALTLGARVKAIETSANRRARLELLGVEVVTDSDDASANVVIDATGSPESMARAFARARYGGRVVWVGIVRAAVPVDDPLFHHRELTLYASRNSAGHFPRIIEMLENGLINSSIWITQRLALDDVPRRFEEVTQHQGLKTVVDVN